MSDNATYSITRSDKIELQELQKAMKDLANLGMDNIFNHKIPIYKNGMMSKGMALIVDSEDTMVKVININNRKTLFRFMGFELSYEKRGR